VDAPKPRNPPPPPSLFCANAANELLVGTPAVVGAVGAAAPPNDPKIRFIGAGDAACVVGVGAPKPPPMVGLLELPNAYAGLFMKVDCCCCAVAAKMDAVAPKAGGAAGFPNMEGVAGAPNTEGGAA